MSPERLRQELLTSQVTGLPNRRAFDEAGPAPAVAMSDADGLKAVNDKYGYDAGNALLKAKADALREAGVEAYHEKGDEFVYRGETPEELKTKLEAARAILRNRPIQVALADGSIVEFKGADFSYGTGSDLTEAESALKANKSEREARGERARGELRGITEARPGEGEKDYRPAERVVPPAESASTRGPDEVAQLRTPGPPTARLVGDSHVPTVSKSEVLTEAIQRTLNNSAELQKIGVDPAQIKTAADAEDMLRRASDHLRQNLDPRDSSVI